MDHSAPPACPRRPDHSVWCATPRADRGPRAGCGCARRDSEGGLENPVPRVVVRLGLRCTGSCTERPLRRSRRPCGWCAGWRPGVCAGVWKGLLLMAGRVGVAVSDVRATPAAYACRLQVRVAEMSLIGNRVAYACRGSVGGRIVLALGPVRVETVPPGPAAAGRQGTVLEETSPCLLLRLPAVLPRPCLRPVLLSRLSRCRPPRRTTTAIALSPGS